MNHHNQQLPSFCQTLATTSKALSNIVPLQRGRQKHLIGADGNDNDNTTDDDNVSSSSTEDDTSQPSQNSLTILSRGAFPSVKSPSLWIPLNPEKNHVKPEREIILHPNLITTEDDHSRREQKKRSKNWTRAETLKLIEARSVLDERFQKSGRKAPLWDEVSGYLHSANFARDGQQCKDKWEKLTAGYKEVRAGAREKEDHPFYEELHPLLGWKSYTGSGRDDSHGIDRCAIGNDNENDNKRVKIEEVVKDRCPLTIVDGKTFGDIPQTHAVPVADIGVLLETFLVRQQEFFKDVLEAVERKEQYRERMRHKMEEKWRAEEQAQRLTFNNAMLVLTQKLVGERLTDARTTDNVRGTMVTTTRCVLMPPNGLGHVNPKKRSKNWKKSEVFSLIRFRREMENRFLKSTRRAGLWEELGEKLGSLGITRDGKQCREKWDKLMAEYKDVIDGKKEKEESSYFVELSTFMGRTKEVECNAPIETQVGNKEVYGGDS